MFETVRESPFKSKDYQKLENNKQTIIKKLLTVFTYYCGKVSKYNYLDMQEKYFMEMVCEVWAFAGKENQMQRNSQKWVSVATLYYAKGIM
jgi:hypothetical protein